VTSANKFTFDVTATDNASSTVKTITSAVTGLVSPLNAAAAALEKMAVAQKQLGIKVSTAGATTAVNTTIAAIARQQAAEQKAAQTRANLVARSGDQEQRALDQIKLAEERRAAASQRLSAVQQTTSVQRISALDKEIARSQALVDQNRLAVQAAQQAAALAYRQARTGTGSANGTGAGDARASAAAQQALAASQGRLLVSERELTAAVALRNKELNAAAAAQARLNAAAAATAAKGVSASNAAAAAQAKLTAQSSANAAKSQAAIDAEAAAVLRVVQVNERRLAQQNLLAAKSQVGGAVRLAALDAEIARTSQVVAGYQAQVRAAQQLYATTSRGRTMGAGNTTTGVQDAQNAAQASRLLVQAQARLRQAEQDLTTATRARSVEQDRANRATQAAIDASQRHEVSLNTTRYALYQVAAAYRQMAMAAGQAVVSVVKTAIAFEASFAQVARTTGLGAAVRDGSQEAVAELAVLRQSLVGLSRDIPVAFDALTTIASLGAQLGIASADVAQFTEVVAKFSAISNVSAEQSATYFGRLQNILDVPTAKFQNLASAVTQLGVNSVATESEILAVATQIGAMANNAGFSAQYVVGLATALASVRVQPELARGTTTRVFQNISRAASEGGDALNAYAKVLGITAEAAAALWESNPEQFFSGLINGLGKANEAGQNLTPILDELGIKGARDVPVITRLANSYKLLGTYTEDAYSSFAAGTYLDVSFETIADKTQAALTKMAGSFAALQDSIGVSFLKPIKWVADALNNLFTWLSNLPDVLTASTVGIVAAAAVLFAFRAAVALAGAAIYAFSAAAKGLGVESLRAGNILRVLVREHGAAAVAARANAAATAQAAAAQAALVAAATPAAVAEGALATTLAVEAETAAAATVATGGAVVATAAIPPVAIASTGALAGLASGFRALAVAIGPLGWALLGIGALVGIIAGLSNSEDEAAIAAEKLKQEQIALNTAWQQSGLGADALAKAIQSDTQAYKDAGYQATEANGVYKVFSRTITELADGSRVASTSISDGLGHGLGVADDIVVRGAGHFQEFNKTLENATGVQGPLASATEDTNKALGHQVTAVGEAVDAWRNAALFEQLSSAFNTPEMQDAILALGDDFKEAVKIGITPGPEGGAAGIKKYFSGITNAIVKERADLQAKIAEFEAYGYTKRPGGAVDFKQDQIDQAAYKARLAQINATWDAIDALITKFREADNAIDQATISGQINEVLKEVGLIDEEAVPGLDGTTAAAKSLAEQLSDTATAFTDMFDAAFAGTNQTGALIDAFEKLGASINDNGTDFSNMSEAGRANLSALEDTVGAYADIQAAAVEDGSISFEQASANMAAFISDLMNQLSAQGIDVSQLDFLAQYATNLSNADYHITIGADNSAALLAIQQVANFASQTMQNFRVLLGVNKQHTDSIMSRAGHPSGGQPITSRPRTAPASVRPTAPDSGALNAALASGRQAAAAKDLEGAQKGAGAAGKEAGKAAEDAAKGAADAIKAESDYVNKLAGYFKDLAGEAFSAVKAEGQTWRTALRSTL